MIRYYSHFFILAVTTLLSRAADVVPTMTPPDDIIIPPTFPGGGLPDPGCDPQERVCELTAGSIDDNLNFVTYEIYKDRAYTADTAKEEQYLLPNPDLSDRLVVSIKDQGMNDFSCAKVQVGGTEVELSAGTDGKVYLFSEVDQLPPRPWTLIPKTPDDVPSDMDSKVVLLGDQMIELIVSIASTQEVDKMDLALVLDTTGSMCDEIEFLQDELETVITELPTAVGRTIDLRFALIVYKDTTDTYLTLTYGFDEPTAGLTELAAEMCAGGGDYPEAVESAWQAATQLEWRTGNVARVALLVGDAPPHRDNINEAYLAALELRKLGVSIYGMAASGTDDVLEYLFRLASLLSGGGYMWLTSDSEIGGVKTDAKVACFQVTQMQGLLTRVLRGALDGVRYEALESEIIREVGEQEGGVCIIDLSDPESALTATDNDSAGLGGGGGGLETLGGGRDPLSEPGAPAPGTAPIAGLPTSPPPLTVCFPGETTVEVGGKGLIQMRDLVVGDMVRTEGNDFSKVYSFGHYDQHAKAEYLKFEAKDIMKPVEVSRDHMLFIEQESEVKAVPAAAVVVGDLIVLVSGGVAPVTKISKVLRTGAFAPFTMSGTIGVNEVVASSYVSLQEDDVFMIGGMRTPVSMQWLAHASQAPHRMVCKVAWNVCATASYNSEGLSHWVHTPMMVGKWIVSQNTWVMAALSPFILVTAVSFSLVEALFVYPLIAAAFITIVLFYRQGKQ